eukprot:TRINITY_DN13671_c0_g1_i1.p1 TRINITY_DN13671_c0_g1~~TRINITY_DN13671_c0_g1_i1.p1  ORF type:complete len:319 (+),score=115.91 TRINITY_DN13671_c0_g1_i1:133-957(+)
MAAAGTAALGVAPGTAALGVAPDMLLQTRLPGFASGDVPVPAAPTQDERPRRLHVAPLSPEVEQEQLRQFFDHCGEILQISLHTGMSSGGEHRYAFVEFATHDSAVQALKLRGLRLGAHELKINPSNPKPEAAGGDPGMRFVEKTPEEVQNEWAYTHLLFEQRQMYLNYMRQKEQAKAEKKARKEAKLRRKLEKLERQDRMDDRKDKKDKKRKRGRSSSSSESSSSLPEKKRRKEKRDRDRGHKDSKSKKDRERRRRRDPSSSAPSPPRPAICR